MPYHMARELIWLEDSTFAAWGCSQCGWIVTNAGITAAGKPPARVKDAFDKHECAGNGPYSGREMRRSPESYPAMR
jgi:hypothetical protein